MAIPGTHNFEVYAGDSPQSKRWQIFHGDTVTPKDISGASIVMQARPDIFGAPFITLTAIIDDASKGAFHFEFPPDLSRLVPHTSKASFIYDIEMRRNGEIKTLVRGTLTVIKDVTRQGNAE